MCVCVCVCVYMHVCMHILNLRLRRMRNPRGLTFVKVHNIL